METGEANGEDLQNSTPSLRRHYPVQVRRVLSQPFVMFRTAPRGMSTAKIAKEILNPKCNFITYLTLNTKHFS